MTLYEAEPEAEIALDEAQPPLDTALPDDEASAPVMTDVPAAPGAEESREDSPETPIEDMPVKPEYFEGEPRFEDDAVRPKPRLARQRIEARRNQPLKPKTTPAPPTTRGVARPATPTASAQPVVLTRRAQLWNRFLSGVEIAAVVGLVALGVILWQSIQAIERRTAAENASAQATALAQIVPPTPTPIINIPIKVLPGGHTYVGNGEGKFNLDEIPVQYREQYETLLAQLPTTRPVPPPEAPIRIRIPKLKVDSQVVFGDDWEALKLGVGHHIGSANPGQVGNVILAAHNDIYGELFRFLSDMEAGDEVFISTVSKEFKYIVGAKRTVNPDQTEVLDQTTDRRLTLISCYPYRVNTQRIIVIATLVG
jgi:sortase A